LPTAGRETAAPSRFGLPLPAELGDARGYPGQAARNRRTQRVVGGAAHRYRAGRASRATAARIGPAARGRGDRKYGSWGTAGNGTVTPATPPGSATSASPTTSQLRSAPAAVPSAWWVRLRPRHMARSSRSARRLLPGSDLCRAPSVAWKVRRWANGDPVSVPTTPQPSARQEW